MTLNIQISIGNDTKKHGCVFVNGGYESTTGIGRRCYLCGIVWGPEMPGATQISPWVYLYGTVAPTQITYVYGSTINMPVQLP